MTPELLEMARATIRTPAGRRPGELALAKAIVAEAALEESLGSTPARPNGETGQRAPARGDAFSRTGSSFVNEPDPRKEDTPLPEFLGGGSEANKPTPRSSAKDPSVTASKSRGAAPYVLTPAEEKREIDRAMGVRAVTKQQFERTADGGLVMHNIGPTRARELRERGGK